MSAQSKGLKHLPEGFQVVANKEHGKYDFNELFNGNWHILKEGEDFNTPNNPCRVSSVRQYFTTEAKKRNLRLQFAKAPCEDNPKLTQVAIMATPREEGSETSPPKKRTSKKGATAKNRTSKKTTRRTKKGTTSKA